MYSHGPLGPGPWAGGLWTPHRPTPLRGAHRLGPWGCPGWWAAGPAASARPSRIFSLGVPASQLPVCCLFSLFSSLRTRFIPLLASSSVVLPALHMLLALPLFALTSVPSRFPGPGPSGPSGRPGPGALWPFVHRRLRGSSHLGCVGQGPAALLVRWAVGPDPLGPRAALASGPRGPSAHRRLPGSSHLCGVG